MWRSVDCILKCHGHVNKNNAYTGWIRSLLIPWNYDIQLLLWDQQRNGAKKLDASTSSTTQHISLFVKLSLEFHIFILLFVAGNPFIDSNVIWCTVAFCIRSVSQVYDRLCRPHTFQPRKDGYAFHVRLFERLNGPQ